MLKVGIFAPYTRNETTLAAVQFADWLIRCGIEVSFLSEGKVDSGIHAFWDKKVIKATTKSTYAWAYGATHLCWFSPNLVALHNSRVVTTSNDHASTKHFYFPHWVKWDKNCDHFLTQADRIISLSRDVHLWLGINHPVHQLSSDRTWANLVSAATVLLPKHGLIESGKLKLLAVMPKTVPKDLGINILDVFDFLLNTHECVSITVLLERSWPRNYRRKLSRLAATYDNRISVITSPGYSTYVTIARAHDWVYVANTRHTYGSLLSTLVVSSVPVVCHDVPPVGAHICDRTNGRLIKCDLHDEIYPIGRVEFDDIGNLLDEIVNEPVIVLKAMQLAAVESLLTKQKAFQKFINQEFIS